MIAQGLEGGGVDPPRVVFQCDLQGYLAHDGLARTGGSANQDVAFGKDEGCNGQLPRVEGEGEVRLDEVMCSGGCGCEMIRIIAIVDRVGDIVIGVPNSDIADAMDTNDDEGGLAETAAEDAQREERAGDRWKMPKPFLVTLEFNAKAAQWLCIMDEAAHDYSNNCY